MANYSEEEIQKVWEKGQEVVRFDPALYRKDVAGAWMDRAKYGKNEMYGWVIDHIYPESKGGGGDMINLRPMQWANNLSKDNDYPIYCTVISSNERSGIEKKQVLEVEKGLQIKLKELYGESIEKENLRF